MGEIAKSVQSFCEDMSDLMFSIPCIGVVYRGVAVSRYQNAREALGLRPE